MFCFGFLFVGYRKKTLVATLSGGQREYGGETPPCVEAWRPRIEPHSLLPTWVCLFYGTFGAFPVLKDVVLVGSMLHL